MSQNEYHIPAMLLRNCVDSFQPEWNRRFMNQLLGLFSQFPLPDEVDALNKQLSQISQVVGRFDGGSRVDIRGFLSGLHGGLPDWAPLIKTMILLYRRDRATFVEGLLAKTFHLDLTSKVRKEIDTLYALIEQEWFAAIPAARLPSLKEYLSTEFIEKSSEGITLPERQYDEKFHILQAPDLFFKDVAYFRAKCEQRGKPVAVTYLDIDAFGTFNRTYNETLVDRNLLPRFMQAIEAQVYHHGYAYRQGGDEYIVLVPSLSRALAINFFDELRLTLAGLKYPEIEGSTTVSIGLCIADPDCPLTDREVLAAANEAKKYAKNNGKNRIATYKGTRLVPEELEVVRGASDTGKAES